MRISNEMQTGKAGEYLACADLILKGLVAYPSEQGLPYDILIDLEDRFLKVQVKSTLEPRIVPQRSIETRAYMFNVKRCGKNGIHRYGPEDIDIFAIVALDTREVGYLKGADFPTTLSIRDDRRRGSHHDEAAVMNFNIVQDLAKKGKTTKEIHAETGLNQSTIYRMLQDGYEPHRSGAPYFSDFFRDKNWF